ncbi:MAG: hypothetical protein KKH94_10695 [Candidatus Omnitrophica bacterium]|nr:hypothetical protein [Candidatus Omnitrophota bacterium]
MPQRFDGCGQAWKDIRSVFDGILWILRIGALGKDMPQVLAEDFRD